AARAAELHLPFFRISGATGAGVGELVEAMWARLAATPQAPSTAAREAAEPRAEEEVPPRR
ncbi:MAG TPA: hypothetical protein VI258_02175, partial [Rhodanobacteraceae bacterium]